MMIPRLTKEKPYSEVDWPVVHLWDNGVVIVEEQSHILLWDEETDMWRRYEWAALSDFPKPATTLTGLVALSYILQRAGG